MLDATKDPVAGARVVVKASGADELASTTEDDGVARFDVPGAGIARIGVTAPGLTMTAPAIFVKYGEDGASRTVLLYPAIAIDGTVREATGGAGIAGARVEAVDWPSLASGAIAATVTGGDGSFHLDGVPEGDVRLRVSASRHRTAFVSVGTARLGPVDVKLEAGAVVRGTVTGPGGAPVSGATVFVNRGDRSAALVGVSAVDGSYEVGGIDTGDHLTVGASKAGFANSGAREATIDPSAHEAVVDLQLRAMARVEVEVLRPDGGVVDGADVRVLAAGRTFGGQASDAPGWMVFDAVEPGSALVVAEADGFATSVTEVTFAPEQNAPVTVRLAESVAFGGVVVDDAGDAVPGAYVSVTVARDASVLDARRYATTAADGRFRVERLGPGPHRATASARDHEAAAEADTVAPDDRARFVVRRLGRLRVVVRAPSEPPGPVETSLCVTSRGVHVADWRPLIGAETEVACPAGTVEIRVEAEGYLVEERTVETVPGGPGPLVDILLDPGVPLVGRVVDKDGFPVPRARLFAHFGVERPKAEADRSGAFRFDHLPHGPMTVTAQATGYGDTRIVYANAPDSVPLVVVMLRGGIVRGTARDVTGAPLAGVGVTVVSIDDDAESPVPSREVDADGTFRVRVPQGRWRVTLLRAHTPLVSRDVEVRDEEETAIELVVDR